MRCRAPFVALVVLAVGAPAARAQVKEPAELLPASTLASVEVRQPARLARELAALVKGSAFEDMPGAIARFRAKDPFFGNMWAFYELRTISMFLSPEMLAEGARLRGGILGLTGLDKEKGPGYVGVLLTGESNVPGIYLRDKLMYGQVRLASRYEGVSIYQEQRVNYTYQVPPGADRPLPTPTRTEAPPGPAMALLPGALVFGSSPEAIKDVIRRLKGKSGDPSLASVSAYRKAAQSDDRPGLFAYADFAGLAAAVEATAPRSGREDEWWHILRRVINPRAVPRATAALTLHNGGLELQARLYTEANQKSPLLGLLPDGKAPVELLHFVPRDALLAGAAGLRDGERQWRDALALGDALIKAAFPPGERPPFVPSAAVGELEKQLNLNLGKDVFGRLKGVALFGDVADGKRPGGPVLVLQAGDAKAARALEEEAVPRLLSLLGASEAPKQEEVEGGPIRSVAAKLAPGWDAVHYGRSGAVLVIGANRKCVAEALAAGRKKAGLAGEEAVMAGVKEMGDATVVGVASLGRALVEAYKESERWADPRPAFPALPPGAAPPPGGVPAVRVDPGKLSDATRKRAQELARALGPLPPLVFGLSRQPDGVTLTARQPQLRRVSAKAIDLWVEGALERAARRQFRAATPVPMKAPAAPAPKK